MLEYMIRTLHPVGQGAFFSETFHIDNGFGIEDITTIVYDCGSGQFPCCNFRKEKIFIEKRIEETFEINEKIKAIFISHLDCDHCNGLPFILNRCFVEHLFLPLMTDNEKFYYLLKQKRKFNNMKENNLIMDLIIDPQGTVKKICEDQPQKTPKIHWVSPYLLSEDRTNDIFNENILIDDLPDNSNVSAQNVLSFKNLQTSIFNDWCFIPYNLRFDFTC